LQLIGAAIAMAAVAPLTTGSADLFSSPWPSHHCCLGKKNGGINAINSSQNGFFIIALYDYLQHSIDIQVV